MLNKLVVDKRLGEHVRWLVISVNFQEFKRVVFACAKLDEVEVLDIYVLGSRSHLWELADGEGG